MAIDILDKIQEGDAVTIDLYTQHPLYAEMQDEWEKCRDCYGGEKAVKSKDTLYLPRLQDQTIDEYENYKKRAQFYGATSRTVEAYLGMIFRKPVSFKAYYEGEETKELDEFMARYLDSMTVDGKNLNEFAHEVTEELIVTNRAGLLVDLPYVESAPMSIFDYEQRDIKPIISLYKTETILNWYTIKENGRDIPVMYVLYEPFEEFDQENSISPSEVPGFRILYLENFSDPNPRNRVYKMIRVKQQTTQRRLRKTGGLVVTDVSYPMRNGMYLNHIPFYVISDQGLDYRRVRNPMISDLANVNLGHYRNSADLENELHFVSLKTIAYPGWNVKSDGHPRVGGAIATPKGNTPVLLEPTSDSSIREEMILKEARLAVLGAERISQKQRYLPSASVAEITASAEASVIQNFLTSLNLAINRVVKDAVEWARVAWAEYNQGELKVTIQINNDLTDNALTGADLVNFISAYQQGGISIDTLYYNLSRREIYPEGWSLAKELESLTKTQDLILGHAMQKVVQGETGNPFFRQEEESSPEGQSRQTASSGRGEDVTVRSLGETARVRIS